MQFTSEANFFCSCLCLRHVNIETPAEMKHNAIELHIGCPYLINLLTYDKPQPAKSQVSNKP